jgi:hypothetical protein
MSSNPASRFACHLCSPWGTDPPPRSHVQPHISLRQHDLTPLNLIAAETGRSLAMWADDRRLASDGNLEIRAITWID